MQNSNEEMGSFIELQFQSGLEFYKGEKDIIRLNSGRAAIWHAFRLTKCKKIWLPFYQCESVPSFLHRKGVAICIYHIDRTFEPLDLKPSEDDAVLLVNYFGIMSQKRMSCLASNYKNVIIDSSQAFFAKPIENCFNVYSARKFVGVPDGAYVIGKDAQLFNSEYLQGYSSDTSVFLLMRHEYGCEGKAYEAREHNESRIDSEDIKVMSVLTRRILDGIQYDKVIKTRKRNFAVAAKFLDEHNLINVEKHFSDSCVPMVYPLVIENEKIMQKLLARKHFQGHWWGYLTKEKYKGTTEYWLSKYMIPITIDQRYGEKDIKDLCAIAIEGGD